MKKILCKYKKKVITFFLWSVVGVFFCLVIPLAINYAFTRPALIPLFEVDWEAKDALAFYGSLLGAAATIFVLRQTIVFTKENQKEERKLSVKPYLQTQFKMIEDVTDDLYKEKFTFVQIKNDVIEISESPPDEINDLKILWNRAVRSKSNSISGYDMLYAQKATQYFKSNLMLQYEVQNCGANNAIDVKFKIDDWNSFPHFCITTSYPKKFILILNEKLLVDTQRKICFSFIFSDICSISRYKQTESINFYRSKEEHKLSYYRMSEDLMDLPEETEEDN